MTPRTHQRIVEALAVLALVVAAAAAVVGVVLLFR
jgi:hypothetical protein